MLQKVPIYLKLMILTLLFILIAHITKLNVILYLDLDVTFSES